MPFLLCPQGGADTPGSGAVEFWADFRNRARRSTGAAEQRGEPDSAGAREDQTRERGHAGKRAMKTVATE